MTNPTDSPRALRSWREARGLSMRVAMELAGNPAEFGWRTWSDWERGERPLPWYLPAVLAYIDDQKPP